MKFASLIVTAIFASSLWAAAPGDYLVKFAPGAQTQGIQTLQQLAPEGTQIKDLGINGWTHVKLSGPQVASTSMKALRSLPGVLAVEPNRTIKLFNDYKVQNKLIRAEIKRRAEAGTLFFEQPPADNPAIPTSGSGGSGADPLFSKQWGMNQMGVRDGWNFSKGNPEVIVAVIDTGVDYGHEDLVDNMWRNPGETGRDAQGRDKATNGIDDDGNGYIDDVVGWDFVSNDNKPYDLTSSVMEMLMGGGNPGHGTHCAGNVAARGDNGKGIAGVAPNVRIMALRFISEKGQGTMDAAIGAIKYAVDNGAKITSNSWGTEGDPGAEGQALRDAITYAEQKGALFVAAAGNGHQGVGYDNDTDSKPAFPASYPHESIISVAALAENGSLGSFSNWGRNSVDIGAPGVKVFSTITLSAKYSDTVIDIPGLITATWDGTSMATPHVAGAAALYWSLHPNKSWQEVKTAILRSAKANSQIASKVSSGGQLDVQNLMRF